MNNLSKIKIEIANFEKLQEKYAKVGAYDTEPEYHFQRLIWDYVFIGGTIAGKIHKQIKKDDWHLFKSVKGFSKAFKALDDQATKILMLIATCPISELEEIKEFIKSYCWRCR